MIKRMLTPQREKKCPRQKFLKIWPQPSPCHVTWLAALLLGDPGYSFSKKYWPTRKLQSFIMAARVVFGKCAQNAQELLWAFLCLLALRAIWDEALIKQGGWRSSSMSTLFQGLPFHVPLHLASTWHLTDRPGHGKRDRRPNHSRWYQSAPCEVGWKVSRSLQYEKPSGWKTFNWVGNTRRGGRRCLHRRSKWLTPELCPHLWLWTARDGERIGVSLTLSPSQTHDYGIRQKTNKQTKTSKQKTNEQNTIRDLANPLPQNDLI